MLQGDATGYTGAVHNWSRAATVSPAAERRHHRRRPRRRQRRRAENRRAEVGGGRGAAELVGGERAGLVSNSISDANQPGTFVWEPTHRAGANTQGESQRQTAADHVAPPDGQQHLMSGNCAGSEIGAASLDVGAIL